MKKTGKKAITRFRVEEGSLPSAPSAPRPTIFFRPERILVPTHMFIPNHLLRFFQPVIGEEEN